MTQRPAPRPAPRKTPPPALRSKAGQPANKPCATCQKLQQRKVPPCDFDKLEFSCKHCGVADKREIKSVAFWLDMGRGKIMTNQVHSPNKRNPRVTDRFEVIDPDTITVKASGGPGYSPGHPALTIQPPANLGPAKVLRGPVHQVAVGYEPNWFRNRLNNLGRLGFFAGLRQFFFPPPAVWVITMAACGARPAPQPKAFYSWKHKIAVYPPDIFKIGLSLPSVRKKEKAHSWGNEGKVAYDTRSSSDTRGMARTSHSVKEDVRTSGNTELYRRTESAGNRHDTITQTQQLGTIRGRDYASDKYETGGAVDSRTLATAKSFTFTRNGKDWTQSFKAAEFIEFLLNLRKQILGLIEFFKAIANRMPKIGWSFSVEVEVCAGSLEYEWGYKEWPKNHTVYRYYKVEVALTIVSAKAEIAFGLELLSAKAQVYGAVTGELKLTFTREANPDRTGPAATISVPPSVGGEIGVRGALGDWVEVVGKINAGFEGAAVMELAPFALKANFDLSPGKGTFTAKSKLFFSVTKQATLWEKRPIWSRTIL
ncbi:hypothetical protein [Nannocystis punicea]|uniref:Uncharacterized protein n=1 Tax=Nannocystis punicea TaxID=2995304 RepID=A0ABY7GXL7_9BACT|nr:hypothetical protein [Nannocystis poenicansa]WAS91724.1 hypothetical protein O0S08_36545 [Nannocystis poenicansa]